MKSYLAALLALVWWSVAQATDHAVVVGVGSYDPSYLGAWESLSGCQADVANVKDMLVGACGWSPGAVEVLTDAQATKSAIVSRLTEIAATVKSGDRVLFYQSSHGTAENGESALCCHDADLTASEFASVLSAFGDGVRVLVVLDACRSGGMYGDYGEEGDGEAADFAARTISRLREIRGRREMGARSPATESYPGDASGTSAAQIGWITAVAAPYDAADLGETEGGAFTYLLVNQVVTGVADLQSAGGDGNGVVTAYEAARAIAGAYEYWTESPPCIYNESVCRDFELAPANAGEVTLVQAPAGTSGWTARVEEWYMRIVFAGLPMPVWTLLGELEMPSWYAERTGFGICLRSAPLLDYQRAYLETQVEGAGVVSFQWKASSQALGDMLQFKVDGERVAQISGIDGGWESVSHAIAAAGSHRLTWVYLKDDAEVEGEDCGRLVDVNWKPARSEPGPESGVGAIKAASAAIFDGWLSESGTGVVGVVTVKAAKYTPRKTSRKLTAKVSWKSGKRESYSGYHYVGEAVTKLTTRDGRSLELRFDGDEFQGSCGGCAIQGCRNRFAGREAGDSEFAGQTLKRMRGAIGVAWGGDGGWSVLSATVGAKGKTKVVGRLADGTRLSAAGQLLSSEGTVSAVPVLMVKKSPMGLMLRLEDERSVEVEGLNVQAVGRPGAKLGANLRMGELPAGCKRLGDTEAERCRLRLASRTGVVSGTFKVEVNVGGKVRSRKASAYGVSIGDCAYGTAALNRIGSWAILVD